jgi:hypothetical protein
MHYADDVASEKVKRGKFLRADGLRACPFCRELFVEGETENCPECGIAVRDLQDLPDSPDAERLILEEVGARQIKATIPQAEPLPWSDLSRGRGLLCAIALLGLGAFYLPWAVQTVPETFRFTGADMAHKASFYWASFTAWLVLFPAAASRRTILRMHGARPALMMLSAVPAVACGWLLTKKTKFLIKGVPFEYHWGIGFWATVALSVAAVLVAFRYGGKLEHITTLRKGSSAPVSTEGMH